MRGHALTTFVALLRGINVSGRRAIPMGALRESCKALGLDDVRTYLQSGNLVVRAGGQRPDELAARLRDAIAREFGHEVDVQALSARQWERVVGANPLRPATGARASLYHATFLSSSVPERRFRSLDLPASAGERAMMVGKVIYLYCPNGYGKTKLSNAFFEKAFQLSATTRNWRTILALRDMCMGR